MIGLVRRRPAAGRQEAGFTLIELLIVMSLMGALVGVLITGLVTAMRASAQVEKAIPGPQASQNLNSWLTADIESAIPATIDIATGALIGCLLSVPETGTVQSVLHFEATDPASPATRYSVSYRYHVADSTLWRTFCVKGEPPSHHAVLVENLSGPPTVEPLETIDPLEPGFPKISLSLTATVVMKDRSYTFTLLGSVRTPKDPPVTVPISGTTLPPKNPCAYTSATVGTMGRAGTGSQEKLTGSVTFVVTTNLNIGTGSTCEDLWLQVDCKPAGGCGSSSSGASQQVLHLTQRCPNPLLVPPVPPSLGCKIVALPAVQSHSIWELQLTCPAGSPPEVLLFCDDTWKKRPEGYVISVIDGYVPASPVTANPINQGVKVLGPNYVLVVNP